MYFVKTPWWIRQVYPTITWRIPTKIKTLFLTFDDGPHPAATPFVLDTLQQYNAKATFFCIGENVVQQPAVYERIQREGHAIGNHTYNHLNGWKTNTPDYLQNIAQASNVIGSRLFRPPYGRITRKQAALVRRSHHVIMWDVLSGDFDTSLSAEKSLQYVLSNAGAGSIVVFHDSEKAFRIVKEILPKVLEHFARLGYTFQAIDTALLAR